MGRIAEEYGTLVFNDHTMQELLPSETYKALSKTIKQGKPLDPDVANIVAHAMKEWAVAHGATHYTHWFQPLSGITSEKHDAFVSPQGDGRAIMTFSGKALIQGEPDASSFPSGGVRATFEARGYTTWDPTSYAFIKDEVLCIPTAFCSYTGEALDKKTPLLRSMEAISQQACKVLALFGQDVLRVTTTVGAEQEYFLIRESDYEQRQDLVLTGRTLFGAPPCKGQELEEHYFGAIRPTVNEFMKELDEALWKLGVPAKTKHNEVAPCQHELAPTYAISNVAIDHNLLTMELMRTIASHHGLVCLQHEKPFEGINGSGKHNNWSIATDTENLLDPGKTPASNLRFLVFLAAVIEAVDDYQDLLRITVASAGNDHRLGANEAPPAVISIFLGDELERVINAIIAGEEDQTVEKVYMDLGVKVLPNFERDNTDRNRTSPFAFTGNKFEFRMPGSQINLADANTILNTIVAKSLKNFHTAVKDADDFEKATFDWVRTTLTEHARIIFNGDGYTDEWVEEAERRGLLNLKSTVDAAPHMLDPKNIALFKEFGVLDEVENRSRYEVKLDTYSKLINIEGQTMSHMTKRKIAPAVSAFAEQVADTVNAKKQANPELRPTADLKLLDKLNDGANEISDAVDVLDGALAKAQGMTDALAKARSYHDDVLSAMERLRAACDQMETIVSTKAWPLPTYNKILFYC
ncbi:MAG: glutamine synthetase III [Actinomycetota bacterium]|nr:glutamine synthetase III [Actinomycetota bacterium]